MSPAPECSEFSSVYNPPPPSCQWCLEVEVVSIPACFMEPGCRVAVVWHHVAVVVRS